VLGQDQAALIDTGMGIGSLLSIVRTITSLPLVVINTHGHPDHAGGNVEFSHCLMHPSDRKWFYKMCTTLFRRDDIQKISPSNPNEFAAILQPQAVVPEPVEHGAIIQLGHRILRVFHVPGHTPGSVCLYDETTQTIFAGDSLSNNAVWLFGEYSEPMQIYYQSMQELGSAFPSARRIFVGHQPECLAVKAIEDMVMCVRRVLLYDAKGSHTHTFAGDGLLYRYGNSQIIYNPTNMFVK